MAGMPTAGGGLRAGGIIGRFDHCFALLFDDTNTESRTRATRRSPCLGGMGQAPDERTVGLLFVSPYRRAFVASRRRGRGEWDEPVPACYFSFHSEAKDTPRGTRLDEFAVDDFDRASSSKGFRGLREAGMDGGRRGGHAVLTSDRIRGLRVYRPEVVISYSFSSSRYLAYSSNCGVGVSFTLTNIRHTE